MNEFRALITITVLMLFFITMQRGWHNLDIFSLLIYLCQAIVILVFTKLMDNSEVKK